MTILIINADDFGYCESVNYGIISAHQFGLVKSTTMMANMPGIEHGVQLLKQYPTLHCGVHLTLSCGHPLLSDHQTIVNEEGVFFKRLTPDVLATFDKDEIYREFCAQIEKVKSLGIEISHLDSHHHVHTLKELEPVMRALLKTYQLPVRGGFEYELDYNKIVPMMDSFYKDTVEIDYFKNQMETIKSYEIVDLMSHPAFLDDFILKSTSYAIDRTKEHKVLTSQAVKDLLEKEKIVIGSYKSYQ